MFLQLCRLLCTLCVQLRLATEQGGSLHPSTASKDTYKLKVLMVYRKEWREESGGVIEEKKGEEGDGGWKGIMTEA